MDRKLTLKKTVILLGIIFSFFNVNAQFNGTYSIGSGEFTTIQQAVDSLVLVGVSGPTTFEIDSGTYVQAISISEISGASETNRIIFKAKNDSIDDVIIQSTAYATVIFNGADYITFKSLTITNTSKRCVSIGNGANHITIDSCIFIGRNMLANNRDYDVIVNENTSNDSYTTIQNCHISRGSIGIYLYGFTDNPDEKGHVVKNNTFEDVYVHDIITARADSILITGNEVLNNTNATHNNACAILLQIAGNSEISNNKIITHKHGIRVHRCDSGLKNIVKNNMVTVKRSNSAYYYPLYISGGNKNVKVYNNSFYNSYPFTMGTAFSGYSELDENISLINNIFVSASGRVAMFDSNSDIYNIDFNSFYAMKSGDMFRFDNSWYENLQEASVFLGSNNVSFDPEFISNSDLHVSNPILGNLGTPLPEVEFDFDNDIRNINNPDIGADEFDPFDTLDIAITDVQFVEAPICEAPNNISFTFRNIGSNTINSFKVERIINSEILDTLTQNVTLESYQNVTLTFDYSNFQNGDSIQYSIVEINNNPDQRPENSIYINNGIWLAQKNNILVEDDNQLDSIMNQLNLSGICNSIEIIIGSGTYDQTLFFRDIPGTSEFATVTVRSESGNPNDVVIAPATSPDAVVDIFETDYLTIKDITINAEASNADGIGFYGNAEHLTFDNLIIYADPNGVESGFDSYGSTDDNYLTISNCKVFNGRYGIYVSGSNTEDSVRILNNVISGKVTKSGIYVSDVGNIQLTGNTIQIDSSYNSNGFEIYNVYKGIELVNNQVYIDSTGGAGLDIEYIQGPVSDFSIVANNVISVSGQLWAGVYTYEITNTKFYNNTFIVNSNDVDDYTLFLDYFSVVDIRNNHIIALGYATPLLFNEAPVGITNMDYNNIFTTGNRFADYYGNDITSISEWQSFGWDLNSYSIDPEFFDNYKTCNSVIDNKGIYIDGVPESDLLGQERSITTPDIGAVENLIPSSLNLGDDFLMCNDSYTLYAGLGETFIWNTGDTTQSIDITTTGVYYVEVSGCGLSNSDTIIVNSPELQADFDLISVDNTVVLINTSTGFIDNYLWNIDGFESENINEAITFNADGDYYISLEVSNQCRSDIADTTLIFTYTGIDGLSTGELQVYPNPVSNNLNLSFDSRTNESITVSIYNANGQLEMIYPLAIYTGVNTNSIDVSNLNSGIYYLRLSNLQNAIKILKQ